MEVTGDTCIRGSFVICTARQIILQRSDQGGEMGWALACMGTTEMHTGLWCRNLKEKRSLRSLSGIRQDNIKMILREI
jgi:hypothetical protein